ncbi:hypothetical protein ACQBAT_10760 [Ornithinimicrobium sp. Y1847]|uniref:hypothetical protein n=1 Tax=unclassified Ornithinimicrobium TaxID=2615080 RepID=UPI003B684F5C
MPTTKPRVLVTETEELSAALAAAQRAWPEETSRARLLSRLAIQGSQQLPERSVEARARRRLQALDNPPHRLRGLFPPGSREELRDEWPE